MEIMMAILRVYSALEKREKNRADTSVLFGIHRGFRDDGWQVQEAHGEGQD